MNTIRKIEDVHSDTITIGVPADFQGKQVEIIVKTIHNEHNGKNNLKNLLLRAPTLTQEELQEYNRIREWMSQWNLTGF